MNIRKRTTPRAQAGQSIVETVLMMPVLLMFLLNAVNFGYFFFTITNLAAAPRMGVEYSIMGGATPSAKLAYAASGVALFVYALAVGLTFLLPEPPKVLED